MSFKLYHAIYFDSRGLASSMPRDKNGISSDVYDWVNSTVNGIGEQSVSLFCQARPGRKIEDFYEYFSHNEIVWYKFILSRDTKILKILKVHTYDLEEAIFKIAKEPFPAYEYKFRANVTDVDKTDDGKYETHNSFYIKYNSSYYPPGYESE